MPRVVAVIPAHNEEGSIADTLEALLSQDRIPDCIVVVPNGCKDRTAEIARSVQTQTEHTLIVLELPRLEHKKSEALNTAWRLYAEDADIVICLDADTILPPHAIKNWEEEFVADTNKAITQSKRPKIKDLPLGGSSSKFTMRGGDFLTRLQRAEFARWTETGLARGWTSVLAGTGCAISGEALRQVAALPDREGPWSYSSQVEDFELTYMIRKLGYRCQISPTVRAYTDSMKTVKALWGQRMKWQVGTVEDLLSLGINRLTLLDWFQQFTGLFMAFARFLWVAVIIGQITLGMFRFNALWMLVTPALFVLLELYSALRIPHRDRKDVWLALCIIPSETFAWLRSGWFTKAWIDVLVSKMTGKRKDRWALQYAAEASTN